ncbi:MAG: hypothetical protein AB7I27_02215 [Bacteriovoracaceae bacterium]
MKFLILLLLIMSCASEETKKLELDPIGDNFLIAFDKCRSLAVNLKNGQLGEVQSSPFDLYCKVARFDAVCDFFHPGENKRFDTRTFNGGLNYELGRFSHEHQAIRFDVKTKFAYFEGTPDLKGTKFEGKKVCSGVFILEKEAKKKKQ